MTRDPSMPGCRETTPVGGLGVLGFGVVILWCPVLLACSTSPAPREAQDDAGTRTARALSCDPKTIRPGDTLTITMRLPHPLELAISGPNDSWYWLQSEDPGVPSLFPSEEFARLAELRLDVDTAQGAVWSDTGPEKHRIFVAGGKYTIHLAANLETEPENTLSFEDTVTYVAPDTREE